MSEDGERGFFTDLKSSVKTQIQQAVSEGGFDSIIDKLISKLKVDILKITEKQVYEQARSIKIANGPFRSCVETAVEHSPSLGFGLGPLEDKAKAKIAKCMDKHLKKMENKSQNNNVQQEPDDEFDNMVKGVMEKHKLVDAIRDSAMKAFKMYLDQNKDFLTKLGICALKNKLGGGYAATTEIPHTPEKPYSQALTDYCQQHPSEAVGTAPHGAGSYGQQSQQVPSNTQPLQPPFGQPPPGQAPYTQNPAPYAQNPAGQAPYAQNPTGAPYAQNPVGQTPYAQTPAGLAHYAQTPAGQSPYGQAPYAQPPPGQAVFNPNAPYNPDVRY